ncbi:hypothetical protein CK203_002408 [Vitis vinifera]|uniref:Retrotransposon gag domain-containing protein n=1 Tax=Vitis vinifera TaxID=29760 RepID=A0A438KI95_VITVI|nr:hypothetical protein CK203_002408 [Vitis vinifera]
MISQYRCGRETAYDIWNSLEDKLLPMTKEKEVQLTNRLQGLKKGTRSLDEYLREFKGVCDALAVVRKPIPQAWVAMALNEEDQDPNFYVDSGATTYIKNNPEFSSTGFVIKDQLQQVLARGTKKVGLYALKENVIQAMTVTISSKASSKA